MILSGLQTIAQLLLASRQRETEVSCLMTAERIVGGVRIMLPGAGVPQIDLTADEVLRIAAAAGIVGGDTVR